MDCKTAQSLVIPYINDQLSDEELENFLDHLKHCKECYEELEIYFTIHYALQKLDEDGKVSFNIQYMLRENLKTARKRVLRRKFLHWCSICIMAAAEILLVLALFTKVELLPDKGIQESSIYQFLWGAEPETEVETETETESETGTETGLPEGESEKQSEDGNTTESASEERRPSSENRNKKDRTASENAQQSAEKTKQTTEVTHE